MILRSEVDETQEVHGQTKLHPDAGKNEGISQLVSRVSNDGSFTPADVGALDLELRKWRKLVQDLRVDARWELQDGAQSPLMTLVIAKGAVKDERIQQIALRLGKDAEADAHEKCELPHLVPRCPDVRESLNIERQNL